MAWHESQRSFDVVRGHGGRSSAGPIVWSPCVSYTNTWKQQRWLRKNPLLVVLDNNIQYSSKLVVKKQQKTSKYWLCAEGNAHP